MKHFKFYTKADIQSLTQIRKFETKIGEAIQSLKTENNWQDSINNSTAKYVVLGIPEDLGVRANFGIGGTDTSWLPFISSFLNLQSNDFLNGENIFVLGHFDFGDLKFLIESNAQNADEKIEAYRHAVITIDDEVEKLIKIIVAANKIPIVIGGGHNNAYPLIKAAAKGLHQLSKIQLAQINAINLDAHADFSATVGRHSGNGFSYAEQDGFLGKYCIVGLHENYLKQNVLMDICNNPFLDFISYEEIFIQENKTFIQAVNHATGFTKDSFVGIELDLDCIQNTLSSAYTPSGITPLQARQYMSITAQDANVAYLHICEGASQLIDSRKDLSIGKLITYLVSDFLKALN